MAVSFIVPIPVHPYAQGTRFYIHLHEPNFRIEKKQAARTGRLLFYA